MASGILFIQNAGFIRTAQHAHVCLFPGYCQKYLFQCPASWCTWCSITQQHRGALLSPWQARVCAYSWQSNFVVLVWIELSGMLSSWISSIPLPECYLRGWWPAIELCPSLSGFLLPSTTAVSLCGVRLTHHRDLLQVATQTFNIILTHSHPLGSKNICGWYFLKV